MIKGDARMKGHGLQTVLLCPTERTKMCFVAMGILPKEGVEVRRWLSLYSLGIAAQTGDQQASQFTILHSNITRLNKSRA